jgi:conjugative relaxase-like TrwC/TraI family protein
VGVLSIGKLVAGQEAYYDLQVAHGRDDYYSGRGEAPGRWTGAAAARLGLAGRVDAAGFAGLLEGRDPSTGETLRPSRGNQKVAAYDLTFSAPKSVSVLFAIAEPDVSGALVEAHEEAVDAAVEYIEAEAVRVRRGRDGVKQLAGQGLVSAAYRHRMSRAEDPQLHTHVVTANLTRGADGRWSALHGYPLYQHAKAAGSLYQAHLREAVRRRLPWVRWGPVHNGQADITTVPSRVLREFSKRRAELEDWLAANGREGRQSAEKAALATRRAKAQYGVQTGTWSELIRARAEELGFGRAELAGLTDQEPVAPAPIDGPAIAARLSGRFGLTEMSNTFEERHAIVEYAAAHQQEASVAAVRGQARRYLDGGDVVAIGVPDEPSYTTEGLLECERQIVSSARVRRGEGAGAVDEGTVDEVLRGLPVALTDDQDAVVRAVAGGGHGVETVEALAGTGKTTMAVALGLVYRHAGYRVLGVAPTGRAARGLAERGIESWTAHRLAGDLDYTGGFSEEPTVLFYDEAGMAPTRQSAQIFAAAEHAGVNVVAIGDSGQLTSVQAGGWLGAVSAQLGAHELREVVRHHDPGRTGGAPGAARPSPRPLRRPQARRRRARRASGRPRSRGGGACGLARRRGADRAGRGGDDRPRQRDPPATERARAGLAFRSWQAGRAGRDRRSSVGGGRAGDRAPQRSLPRRRQRHPRQRRRGRPTGQVNHR